MAEPNRLLMIAYHFPPCKGSSGIQRTLKFCQYLPEFGWQPVVLSANTRAYKDTSPEQLLDVPTGTLVSRAFALDTSRHLAIFGKYPNFLAVPDRWISWWPAGVVAGYRMIRRLKPKVIWSTYPIATAHLIGYTLHRLTGLPWIADLRDPMAQEGYPGDPRVWQSFRWLEGRIAKHAAAVCFTSPGAIDHFRAQNPDAEPARLHLIENGYDEESFAKAEQLAVPPPPGKERPLRLVHSGTLYLSERDPQPLFAALEQLKDEAIVSSGSLQIVLRATGNDEHLSRLITERGIDDIVKLAPPVAYIDALAEMFEADGLLLLQASNCNYQIPAKLYEYIRSGKPILALTDPMGDTAQVLRKSGGGLVADIHSASDIAARMETFLHILGRGPSTETTYDASLLSRHARTRELVTVLDRVSGAEN